MPDAGTDLHSVVTPMVRDLRVLLISLYHPELVRGGAQQVCYELFQGLQDQPGVTPILLASVDAGYPALYKAGARITGFDGRRPRPPAGRRHRRRPA